MSCSSTFSPVSLLRLFSTFFSPFNVDITILVIDMANPHVTNPIRSKIRQFSRIVEIKARARAVKAESGPKEEPEKMPRRSGWESRA